MNQLTKEQLSRLTKAEKLLMIDIIEEQARRLREKADIYRPNMGQLPVHKSEKAIRAVFSGNGAGKTAMGANEAIWALKGYNHIKQRFTPVPCRGIVVLDNPTKVADVWLPELQKWMTIKENQLDKRGKPYHNRLTLDNGSELLFMFHDQSELLFESIEADWVIFDEPPPEKIYKALMRGLRKLGSQPWILFLGTPITAAWMRRLIYDPWSKGESDNIECFRFDSDVNKNNLNWDWMENVFFKNLSEKELRIRRKGEFFDLEGLALAHLFDPSTHVIDKFDWPNQWPVVIAVDPHPSKKHHAIMLGTNNKGDLFYLKEMASDSDPKQFGKELRSFYEGYRVLDFVCDSLGNTPRSGGDGNRSFIEVLQDSRYGGHRVRSTRFKEKDDEDFIQNIQQVLARPETGDVKKPKLQIFKGNKGIIADVENVEWLQYRNLDEFKPKLNITNRDYLACLKYALATGITYLPKKPRSVSTFQRPSPWGRRK